MQVAQVRLVMHEIGRHPVYNPAIARTHACWKLLLLKRSKLWNDGISRDRDRGKEGGLKGE